MVSTWGDLHSSHYLAEMFISPCGLLPLFSASPLEQFSVVNTSFGAATEPWIGSLSSCNVSYGQELSLLPIYLDMAIIFPMPWMPWDCHFTSIQTMVCRMCTICLCAHLCMHIFYFYLAYPCCLESWRQTQWGIDKSLYKWLLLSLTWKTREMLCFYHQLAAGKGEEMEGNSNNFKFNIATLEYSSYFCC